MKTVGLGGRVISCEDGVSADWQGVIVSDNRIERFGRRDDLGGLDGYEVIDLGDATLMPGFVDVHAHAEVVCRTAFRTVDCRAPECSTVSDVADALLAGTVDLEPGEWLVGPANLFFALKPQEGRVPNRAEHDTVPTHRQTRNKYV